jgi:hypothetical protein
MTLAKEVADVIEDKYYGEINVDVSNTAHDGAQHVTVDSKINSEVLKAVYQETGAIVSCVMPLDDRETRVWFSEPTFETKEVTVERETLSFDE